MFSEPRKNIVRHDLIENRELQNFIEPLEPHYPAEPGRKEISLFSRENFSYADNRKITIISNSVVVIRL